MAVGIIAEYNPFHNGHAYQIFKIRQLLGNVEIVSVMSGSFTQRGLPTILDKWTRAYQAINGGCDLILELPFVSVVRSAQDFARNSINLLKSLGIINILAFGSEFTDLEKLKLAANVFKKDFFVSDLKKFMSQGSSYAEIVNKILSRETALNKSILRQPNTILAIEYLRALPKNISPLIIKRVGASHDEKLLRKKFSSAMSIRNELFKEESAWDKISQQIDGNVLKSLQEEKTLGFIKRDLLYLPLLAKLLTTSPDMIKEIFGIVEGLEFRLLESIKLSKNFTELVNNLTTKRYSTSRMQRLLLYLLSNLTKIQVQRLDKVSYARVLAFNERGRKLLKGISRTSNIPLVLKVTQHLNERDIYRRKRLLKTYQEKLMFDVIATNLRAILFEAPRSLNTDFFTSPIFIKNL